MHFLKATATGPIAGEHQGCRRTCASARSVRGRPGTPHALPRPSALPLLALVDADPGRIPRQLAMGRGLRRRCRTLFPRVQSDPAKREVRSRRWVYPALGAGARAIADGPDPPAMAQRRSSLKARAWNLARPIRGRSSITERAANARRKPMRRCGRCEYAAASALHTGKSGYRCVINNTGGRYGRRETRSGTDARRDDQRC